MGKGSDGPDLGGNPNGCGRFGKRMWVVSVQMDPRTDARLSVEASRWNGDHEALVSFRPCANEALVKSKHVSHPHR